MKAVLFVVFACMAGASQAAITSVQGVVADVAVENMPSYVWFKITGQAAPCSLGYFIFGASNTETNKAVYAAVVTSYTAARPVWVQYDNSRTDCLVTAVHLATP